MTPNGAYETFLAVRTHFKDERYNFFRYGGKIPNKKPLSDQFRYIFLKICNDYTYNEYIDFLVCNLYENPKIWVPNLMDSDVKKRYTEFAKKYQAFSYYFEQECLTLFEEYSILESDKSSRFNQIFHTSEDLPDLFKAYVNEVISVDMLIYLNKLFGFLEAWNEAYKNSILYEEFRKKLEKYALFVEPRMNVDKGRQILRKHLL